MKKHVGKVAAVCMIMSVCVWTLWYGLLAKAGSNVEMESASSISVGKSVSGTISTEGEEAWYKFTTPDKNAYYEVFASTATKEKEFSLDLIDAEGGSVDSMSFGAEESGSMCYKLSKKATYYVQVCMNDTETSGKFNFKVASIGDDFEDTLETATALTIGKDVAGKFEAAEDKDYAMITTPDSAQIYEVTFTNVDLEGGAEVALVDADESPVESADAAKGATISFAVKLEKNSKYYLCMAPTDSSATGNYTVKVNAKADNAGDTVEEAVSLALGTNHNGSIELGTDEDYFVFDTTAGDAYYSIAATNKNIAGDMDVELLDAEGASVETLTAATGEGQKFVGKLDSGKKYYLHVTSADGATTGEYNLVVAAIVDDGGDVEENATPVELNLKKDCKIEAAGDVDFFKFTTLADENYYNITLTNTSVTDDINLELLDKDGTSVETITAEKGKSEQLFLKLSPNTQYYVVAVASNTEDTGEYSIKIDAVKDNAGDTIESATPLTLDTVMSGQFEMEGDEDYLQFTALNSNCYYEVSLTNQQVEGEIDLSLSGEAGGVECGLAAGKGASDSMVLKLERNKNYYVSLSAANATGAYSFKVVAIPDNGEDSLQTAGDITLNSATEGKFEIEGDEDYFKFATADADTYYEFAITNASVEEEVTMALLNTEGKPVSEMAVAKGKSNSALLKLDRNKTYYVGITTATATGIYSYSVTAVTDDAGNSIETAKEFALETPTQGKLELNGDVDFAKFTTGDGNNFYEVLFTNETVEKDLTLTLLSADGQNLISIKAAKAGSGSFVMKLERNKMYYLSFASDSARGNYSYVVKASADDSGDTAAEATPMELEKQVSGSLQTATDTDFYKFTTNQVTTAYTVSVTNVSAASGEMAFHVLDDAGQTVATLKAAVGKTVSQTLTLANNKNYYINVAAVGEAAQYNLKVAAKYTAPKTVKLNKKKLTLKVKKKATLKAKVAPTKAVIKTQTWTSSKTKVATVTKKGVVKAKKKGTTTITCKMTFYGGKTKTVKCKVTVK